MHSVAESINNVAETIRGIALQKFTRNET